MSSFEDMDERLADWVDGTMDAKQRERFEAEMRVSPKLREQVAEYEQTVATVRQALTGPELATQQSATRDAADRIMTTLATEAASSDAADGDGEIRAGMFRTGWPLVWAVASAAAVLLIALLVDAWGHSAADPKRQASSAAPMESGKMEPGKMEPGKSIRDGSLGANGPKAPATNDEFATDKVEPGDRTKKVGTVGEKGVLRLELGAPEKEALSAPDRKERPDPKAAGKSAPVRRFEQQEQAAEEPEAGLPQTRKRAKEFLRSGGEAGRMRKRAADNAAGLSRGRGKPSPKSRGPASRSPSGAGGPSLAGPGGASGRGASGPGSSGPGSSGPAGPRTGGASPKARSARGGRAPRGAARGSRGKPQTRDDQDIEDRAQEKPLEYVYRYTLAPPQAAGETLPLLTLTGDAGLFVAGKSATGAAGPDPGKAGSTSKRIDPETTEAEGAQAVLRPLYAFYDPARHVDSFTMSAGRAPSEGAGSGAIAPAESPVLVSSVLVGGLLWSRVAPAAAVPSERRVRGQAGRVPDGRGNPVRSGQERSAGRGARPDVSIGGGAGAAMSESRQQYWLVEGPRSRVAELLRAVRQYADGRKLELRSGEVLVARSASNDRDREGAASPSPVAGSKSKAQRVPTPPASVRSPPKGGSAEPQQRIVIRLRTRRR